MLFVACTYCVMVAKWSRLRRQESRAVDEEVLEFAR